MRRLVAASLAVAVLGFVAVGVPAAGAAREARTTVSGAGADLVTVALDERGDLSLRLRTADQRLHDPAEVRVPGSGGLTGTVPDAAGYAFLGDSGRPVWALGPAGAEFPAWETTGVPAGRLAGDEVTLELVDVAGPGAFHAYTLSPVGVPQVLLGTSPDAPSRAVLPAGRRQGGAVWVFDAAGRHEVTLAVTARLASGRTVTDEATYQVEVPALPATAPPLEPPGRTGASPTTLERQPSTTSDDDTGEGRVVIDDGHVDIGPRFVGDSWTIQIKDDTVSPEVWRNLHDVVLHVVDEAIIEVPSGGDYGFLGEPGDQVWLLPHAQQAGILWPGWNTEHESVVDAVSGDTTWTLREVTGPGEFVLYLTAAFGRPEILFTTREGLPQDMSIPLRTHAHGNWAFTEPGVYHLTLEISASASGEEVSDTRVLAFAVGDGTDPDTAFPPGSDPNGDPDDDGALGQTGLPILLLILGGVVLLLAGAVLMLLTRRRARAAEGGSR